MANNSHREKYYDGVINYKETKKFLRTIGKDLFVTNGYRNSVREQNKREGVFPCFASNKISGNKDLRITKEISIPVNKSNDDFGAQSYCFTEERLFLKPKGGSYDGNYEYTKEQTSFPRLVSSRKYEIEVVFINEFEGIIISAFTDSYEKERGIRKMCYDTNFGDIKTFYSCFDDSIWKELRLPKRLGWLKAQDES